MIYGGTIKKGFSTLLNKAVNVSTCYEAAGAFAYGKLHAVSGAGEIGRTPSDVMVRSLKYTYKLYVQLMRCRMTLSNMLAREQVLVAECIQRTLCPLRSKLWDSAFQDPRQIQLNLLPRCVNAPKQQKPSRFVWRRTFDHGIS
jgi:hypothetical protein